MEALAGEGWPAVQTGSGREALALAEEAEVALAIVEVRLGDLSGYEVCRHLRERRGESLPILFVSHDRIEVSDRIAGLLVGADDYLAKPVALEELLARVRRHLDRARAAEGRPSGLTAREREVLELLVGGLSPAQIGGDLGISPKTVATHVERIYVKLGVHTRAQAVAAAIGLGIVRLEAGAALAAPA